MAVIEVSHYKEVEVPFSQIKVETTRGTGNGGQHKNSTDSCVIMTHKPTGIKAVEDGRSQLTNRENAYKKLKMRINTYYRTGFLEEASEERRDQIGDGSRSDKRRTYRVKDGMVTDHLTNKVASYKDIIRGKIHLLKRE